MWFSVDLPALSTLAFGEKDHDSFCFYNADFILTGAFRVPV